MRTRNGKTLIFIALLAAMSLAATAWACLPGGSISSVNPTSGPPGTSVTVTGRGLHAGEALSIHWNAPDSPAIGEAVGADDGSFTVTGAIPVDSTAGVGTLIIKSGRGGLGRAPFDVLTAPSQVQAGPRLGISPTGDKAESAPPPVAAPPPPPKAAPALPPPPPPPAKPVINAWDDKVALSSDKEASWLDSSLDALKGMFTDLLSRASYPMTPAIFALVLALIGLLFFRARLTRFSRTRKFRRR